MAEYKIPKKVKYRRQQRGRRAGAAKRGTDIAFGEYALKATEAAWITGKQIEAGRVAITRFVKRGGKLVAYDVDRIVRDAKAAALRIRTAAGGRLAPSASR